MENDIHHFRDGNVVLYKRDRSKRWQARLKLPNDKWKRLSTKKNAGIPEFRGQYIDYHAALVFFRGLNLLPGKCSRRDAKRTSPGGPPVRAYPRMLSVFVPEPRNRYTVPGISEFTKTSNNSIYSVSIKNNVHILCVRP